MPTFTTDQTQYVRHWKDTPIIPPPARADRLRLAPGTYVKARCAPAMVGTVHRNDEDGCTVIARGFNPNPRAAFVWTGTKAEFDDVWELD